MAIWELADLPEGREPIGNKLTFLRKRDAAGNITIAIIWVDNIGATSNKILNNNLEKALASKYKIKATWKPTLMLGINLTN